MSVRSILPKYFSQNYFIKFYENEIKGNQIQEMSINYQGNGKKSSTHKFFYIADAKLDVYHKILSTRKLNFHIN